MKAVTPGSTIGILGGGQLGRMLILAGRRMGYRFHVYEPSGSSTAGNIADRHFCAPYDDWEQLAEFSNGVDVVTLEFENIAVEALEFLEQRVPLRPGKKVLEVCQHRLREKRFLAGSGIPHVPFREVHGADELPGALQELGYPAVIKTAAFGYDGKGQILVESADDFRRDVTWDKLGSPDAVVVEKWIPFTREISIVCARSVQGITVPFPVSENVHVNHILHQSMVPARVESRVIREAERLGRELSDALEVVGLLAVEFFVTESGKLLVNEMAPRPHNSGHYTLDACSVSQFEQHVRMVAGFCGVPPALWKPVVMTNLLGDAWNAGEPDWADILNTPGARLHLYDKGETRKGRKMGHINLLADTLEEAKSLSDRLFEKVASAETASP